MNEDFGITRIPTEELKDFNKIIEGIEAKLESAIRGDVCEYVLGTLVGSANVELKNLKAMLVKWNEE